MSEELPVKVGRLEQRVKAMELQRTEDMARHEKERGEDRAVMLETRRVVYGIKEQLGGARLAGRIFIGAAMLLAGVVSAIGTWFATK